MLVEHHKAKDCCFLFHLQLDLLKTVQLSLVYIFIILVKLILSLNYINLKFQLNFNHDRTWYKSSHLPYTKM